jgi:hypothetical protein
MQHVSVYSALIIIGKAAPLQAGVAQRVPGIEGSQIS